MRCAFDLALDKAIAFRSVGALGRLCYAGGVEDPRWSLLLALEDAMDNLDSWVNAYHKGRWVRFWRLTDGTWRAKTTGSKGGPYSLVLSDRHLSCTCEGFKYRNICKHAARLAVKLQKQGVDIAEEIVKPVADGEAA